VQSAFNELAPEQFDAPLVLDIRLIRMQIRCRSCRHVAAVEGITLKCPECGSSKVQIIRGDEFRLIDVSMQVPV
jgi:hydrogenase nickel incorporation protein HypA/HybF